MERVQKLILDPQYRHFLQRTGQHEEGRSFCRHTFGHLLDVARIAWILCLERGLDIPRPLVYAAALLHDIGRFAQYEDSSKDHAEESAVLAEPLLTRYGFDNGEITAIQRAIRAHRQPPQAIGDPLGALLAEADDLARPCYDCAARTGCYKVERMPSLNGIQY